MDTKILHVSDTHLGKQQYGSKTREADFSESFDTTVDIAIEENVDAVIHTGDLFDSRTPSTGSVSDAFQTIKRLEEKGIKFLGIVGNHERKWENQWLDIFENLNNVRRLTNKPIVINDDVAVYGFDSIRESKWESMEFELEEPDEELVTCVCMHELFVELVPPSKADRELKEVIEKLDFKPDMMPLGDFHKAVDQDVSGVPAFYAGATERTSATTEEPTVRVIEIEDNELSSYKWRKIKSVRENVPRPFYTVTVTLKDSTTRGDIRRIIREDTSASDIEESVVVVNLEGSTESAITPREVYEVLENLEVKVPYVSDKRTPEILEFDSENVSDPTSIDMEDLIDEKIEEDEISESVRKIDKEVVRDLTVNKSDIRGIVDEKFDVIEKGEQNED
jgi:exonuclease SbcD